MLFRFPLLLALSLLVVTLGCKTGSDAATTVKGDELDVYARPAQLFRFDPWLGTLRQVLEADPNATLESVADAIVDGPARVAAYNLQALCRLYASEADFFGKMRDDFKGLEDVIGAYDKWNNVLKSAESNHASASVITKLKAKKAGAKDDLKALLADRKWFHPGEGESRLDKMQTHLDEYDWLKYKKDRDLMLGKVKDELKKVDETDYQFEHLEEGDGLHELRRDLKWLVIEMRVLNGMVIFEKHPEQCGVPEYADLVNQPIATSKYSQLPPSETETNACKVPQCLFLGLVQMVEDLGALKDKAEAKINSEDGDSDLDTVPPEIREAVTPLYQKMVDTKLIDAVKDEFKKCL